MPSAQSKLQVQRIHRRHDVISKQRFESCCRCSTSSTTEAAHPRRKRSFTCSTSRSAIPSGSNWRWVKRLR
ncbi:unnamed protein product [Amoebophrya sp. A25]|nr:unnamed protein product [Amoebophrya sp. A25]|eukprot:GSA25T00022688001.1